jgi:acetyltransferase-like isoleucine patch superfamily enzyme
MRSEYERLPGGKVVIGRDVEGIQNAEFEGGNLVRRGTVFDGGPVRVGYASMIGPNSVFNGDIAIGKYSMLGGGVGVFARDHPITHATTYVNPLLFRGRMKEHETVEPIRIGHDVWVGHGATILKGVVVGNGAVVGAGAVVRTNVQPFSVVLGNPARVFGKRFPEEMIDMLEALAWWELRPEQLLEFEDLFHCDLQAEPERARGILKAALKRRGRELVTKRGAPGQ